MITKFLNWLNAPQTKIVKTTYGDGFVTYRGYYRDGRFASWTLAKDHHNYSADSFDSIEKVQNVLDFKVKGINRGRIVKREVV